MSIFAILVRDSKLVVPTDWIFVHDAEKPIIELTCRIKIPVGAIDEDLWYSLDNHFLDEKTGTEYQCYDSDGDDECHWGFFDIRVAGGDIPIALEVLDREVEAFKKLTGAPEQNKTGV